MMKQQSPVLTPNRRQSAKKYDGFVQSRLRIRDMGQEELLRTIANQADQIKTFRSKLKVAITLMEHYGIDEKFIKAWKDYKNATRKQNYNQDAKGSEAV